MTTRIFFRKITKDILISFVITYFLIMVPELILPGLVSARFNPKYLLAAILILGWIFAWQRQDRPGEESLKFKSISKNILNIILFVITIMLVLSLYKMKIWEIAVTTLFSILLLFAAGKMMFEDS